MRILVCGGRTYADKEALKRVMHGIAFGVDDITIIHGGASGADRLAHQIATDAGWHVKAFPADWDAYGKAAGPIRNQQMIDAGAPDIVIAAPGNRGTADMVRRAKSAGVRVVEMS